PGYGRDADGADLAVAGARAGTAGDREHAARPDRPRACVERAAGGRPQPAAARRGERGAVGRVPRRTDQCHPRRGVSTAGCARAPAAGRPGGSPAAAPVPAGRAAPARDGREPPGNACRGRRERARRVDGRPLPDETVDELVRYAVDGEVCGPARIVLRRLAAGNPRYLREVVYSARAGGALRIEGGIWQWYGGLCGDGYLGELV